LIKVTSKLHGTEMPGRPVKSYACALSTAPTFLCLGSLLKELLQNFFFLLIFLVINKKAWQKLLHSRENLKLAT